jgi:hypothetical protein
MAAVIADTGFEPRSVCEHLHWLTERLGSELPVHIVRAMRPDGTPAHIREDMEAIVRGETTRLAAILERRPAVYRGATAGAVRVVPPRPGGIRCRHSNPLEELRQDWGWWATIKDQDGNTIGLHSP